MNNFLQILPAILLLAGFIIMMVCGFLYSLFAGLFVTASLLILLAVLLAPAKGGDR